MRPNQPSLDRLVELERQQADREARQNAAAGIARQLQIYRTSLSSDSSRGGSTGYHVWLRQMMLHYALQFGVDKTVQVFNVSSTSLYRWAIRVSPYKQQGCHQRNVLTEHDQLLLSIAIHLHPISTIDHICTFIANNGGGIYSRQDVSRCLRELGVTRKRGSVKAYAAYTPQNLLRARLFWTQPPRVGVFGVTRRSLIDIDETRFELRYIQNKRGWAYKPIRVRDVGNYSRARSLNLIIAVEPGNPMIPADQIGSIQNPRRRFKITPENVNQHIFSEFVDEICRDIENHPCLGNNDQIFMWDNHSSHGTALVYNTVENRASRNDHRFRIVARPPYQAKWGAVEYIIGQITNDLKICMEVEWTMDTLRKELHHACVRGGLNGVANKTFAFIGY